MEFRSARRAWPSTAQRPLVLPESCTHRPRRIFLATFWVQKRGTAECRWRRGTVRSAHFARALRRRFVHCNTMLACYVTCMHIMPHHIRNHAFSLGTLVRSTSLRSRTRGGGPVLRSYPTPYAVCGVPVLHSILRLGLPVLGSVLCLDVPVLRSVLRF